MNRIEVLPIGTSVECEGIPMVVLGVSIRGKDNPTILYECTWASGREIKEFWFQPWRLKVLDNPTKTVVGFAVA